MRRSLCILLRWPIRGWLHRRCLRRIARLERELGITPPYELREIYERGESVFVAKDDELDRWTLKPGAVWPVESHNDVQIFSRPNGDLLKKERFEDGSALTTLIDTHEAANAAIRHKMTIDGFETVGHRH